MAAMFRCNSCETVSGCEKHSVFKCGTCGRATYWKDGAADDRPGDCSDCWLTWFQPRQDIAVGLFSLLGEQ